MVYWHHDDIRSCSYLHWGQIKISLYISVLYIILVVFPCAKLILIMQILLRVSFLSSLYCFSFLPYHVWLRTTYTQHKFFCLICPQQLNIIDQFTMSKCNIPFSVLPIYTNWLPGHCKQLKFIGVWLGNGLWTTVSAWNTTPFSHSLSNEDARRALISLTNTCFK